MPRCAFLLFFLAALCLTVSPSRASPAREDGEAPGEAGTPPTWSREDMRVFCAGRKTTILQDMRSCMKTHKSKLGHRIDPADMQELEEYRKLHVSRGELEHYKGAVRSTRKASAAKHDGMMRLRRDAVPPPKAAMDPPLMPPGTKYLPQGRPD